MCIVSCFTQIISRDHVAQISRKWLSADNNRERFKTKQNLGLYFSVGKRLWFRMYERKSKFLKQEIKKRQDLGLHLQCQTSDLKTSSKYKFIVRLGPIFEFLLSYVLLSRKALNGQIVFLLIFSCISIMNKPTSFPITVISIAYIVAKLYIFWMIFFSCETLIYFLMWMSHHNNYI